ncbi:proteoglycan 4 isoform X2 [Archocentrus centrarchus]|uniref:proteoglycan 4 isoform X2 n=1 Tax=Archocentrus centrarchus TaxID=63155 RepID=UPI0011EA192C|nr:proteoglycan 4-like isoform X2 [Archocentrus centrarchus]
MCFESILEGLFGSALVEDLKLFKDFEPVVVPDWSFDEKCPFCCLRRDKVKEHLIDLNEGLEDTPKPLLVKDQVIISRLENQAEEFLNAVLCRKDVPNFSDPHIPVVAREILQKMIRQFAAEYTSKTSSPQVSCSDSQPLSDQSLSTPPLLSGAPPATSPAATVAGPAHNQNPVLSKLLMADQDAPLDLTIKKPVVESSEQDGVLDLSIKKKSCSSSLPVHSPCLSPATTMPKGKSLDLHLAKAKDLQSTSTLEQFMAKLCPHHQRQIVDAIGFLQTEIKALSSSSTHKASNCTSGVKGTSCSTAKSSAVTPEKSHPEIIFPSEVTSKSEVRDIAHFVPSSCAMKNVPENAVSLKSSVAPSPVSNLRSPGSGSNQILATPTAHPVDTENNRHGDHAPLKMKIMACNDVAGKKLCVVSPTVSSHSDTLEERHSNSDSSSRTDTQSARLSSLVKRHSQASHTNEARQRVTVGHAKDTPAKSFPVNSPSDCVRTARKTIRTSSDHWTKDSPCRGVVDPDRGHCDIVFIDKPITECFKEQRRSMVPRRNARKSTRGHMYLDEIWELKTVRTMAGRGNCPNPIPEVPLVTPKQMLSKPEGVPPVDMPFVGSCTETKNQQMPTEELDDSIIPGTEDIVEVAASSVDVTVETSQTDQCQNKGQSAPSSPLRSPTENQETVKNTDVEQDAVTDSGMTTGSEESVDQDIAEAIKDNEPEPQEDTHESTEQTMAETVTVPLENISIEETEAQLSSDKLHSSDPVPQQNSAPSPVHNVEEGQKEEVPDEQPQELKPDTQIHNENCEGTESTDITGSVEELTKEDTEIKTSEAVENVAPLESEEDNDSDYDVSSKTLDALLKELPPWRRKKGTKLPLPKPSKQTEPVIVGHVNGRPVSASDRKLRRRPGNATSPGKAPVKSSQNASNNSSESTTDSTTNENNLKKPLPETHIPKNSVETTPVIQEVTELSADAPSTPNSKPKQIQKHKRILKDEDSAPELSDQPTDHPQNPEPKRQLRSASQKPPETPVSHPTSNAATPILSPEPSPEHLPFLPLPCPLSVPASSLNGSCDPASSELSQPNTVTETVELNTDNTQPVETPSEEMETNVEEQRSQVRQKLRSAKVGADDGKKLQLNAEVSSPVKTESQTQIMPLRSKRVPQKKVEASDVALQPNVASLADGSADDSSSFVTDGRMPLRSDESSKAEMACQSVPQLPQMDNKKLTLRSQRLAPAPSTSAITVASRQNDVASPVRIMPERITKAQVRQPSRSVASVSHSSHSPVITPRHEPPKQTTNKFFETLTTEESQKLITNLNIKYEKMQKGWVQMDKEGQPAAKYKNKADRQAAIWKSKRRARKPKSSEHQKYSPVQMLFMKGFNFSNICRWFLETTETKSLVIVKKVTTRLPSESQLCFHNSSSASGTSQGVFPSLQAERLKKHLKKFAIASPVKSNPKSQKLIAKALEQEANSVKGKERGDLSGTSQNLTKYSSAKASAQIGESQKSSGKSKNPASARILRKYSNIREKMQVQQTTSRLKKASKMLKSRKIKRLATTKSASKSNLKQSLKAQKSALPVSKRMKESAAKMERRKILANKKSKQTVKYTAVRAQSSGRASRDISKKELPKRCSQRLGSPKIAEHNPVDTSKSKADNKRHTEASSAKIHSKEPSQSTPTDIKDAGNAVETPQQSMHAKVPTSPDQVLTRSQRKIEAALPLSGSPSHASKRAAKSAGTQNASPKSVKKNDEPTLTRSGALKSPAKRSPRTATKLATKRSLEHVDTPAKRTRTSLLK